LRHVTIPRHFFHAFVRPIMLTITNQGFLTSPQLQGSVRDNILSILNDLNIQPKWHPMREFDYFGINQAEDIWQRIVALDTGENANTNKLGPEYWAVIWEIATITTKGGLEYIAHMIETIVLPGIRETCENVEAHGFNGSGPDLRLDSTFAANGQEDPHMVTKASCKRHSPSREKNRAGLKNNSAKRRARNLALSLPEMEDEVTGSITTSKFTCCIL
jgi:hypothetical protein